MDPIQREDVEDRHSKFHGLDSVSKGNDQEIGNEMDINL